jgi:hypothetical protein
LNAIQQLSNNNDSKTLPSNDFPPEEPSEKREDNLATSQTDNEEDLAGVSNIHFHLTVPRYYSPYEEIPFLYFIDLSTTTYIDQEKHYFTLHMGSSPFTPTYGLLLSNLSSGSYTFHIGRAYNRTWFVFNRLLFHH